MVAWSAEWRTVIQMPIVWLLPPAVAGLAYALVPFNASISEFMNPYDRDTAREIVDTFHADALNVYTAGFGCGQFLSLLFGAGLVLLDRRPARLRASGRSAVDPTSAMPAKLLTAVVVGIALALVDLAVTLPAAAPRARHLWDTYGFGYVADPNLLHDPAVRSAVILGVAGFPLWAAMGVGLGALAGGWAALVRFLGGGAIVTTCVFYGTAGLGGSIWATMGIALVPPPVLPPSTVLSLAATVGSPYRWPTAVSGTLGAVLYAVLFYGAGRAVLRRRFVRERAGSAPA
ncbi:hypothetical protein Raf01_14090 [Rugosimonospora africana]|uniref:Uncharacterized protein n=1 Tax=Rugosimonospora africana TaxID=556532 RepID=A0A8J3QP91_9ACTN|nr:hypothetical protein Raf01_14090 [Rugosimonospora africana]